MPLMRASKFVGADVWSAIGQLLRLNQSVIAVIAYVSEGARNVLKLKNGDALITDASLGAVKTGQTDPHVLLALQSKGVRIYSYPGLHAKVVILSDRAIVGSAMRHCL